MNIVLWIVQAVLAFLLLAGGATKAFKFDELAKQPAMSALPRGVWRVIGVLEMLGAVLLIVPAATGWMPELTLLAAGALALESLALSGIYARHSRQLSAANPLVWSAVIGVLAALVAFGRYALSPLV